MTNNSQPRGKAQVDEAAKTTKPELPNAVDPNPMSVLIAKKRHMAGLICPPMGAIPAARDKAHEKH